MKDIAFADLFSFWRRASVLLLVFTWCFGLSCGFCFASYAEPFSVSWMYALVNKRGSILGLLAVNLLPFVITLLAIRFRASGLIIPVAFAKSFLIGFCHLSIYMAFGNAGWMIHALFMFSQPITAALLLWFWIRNINQTGQWHIKESVLYAIACLGLSILEYLLVSPFLASLMVY